MGDIESTLQALESFRAGRAVEARCGRCGELLRVARCEPALGRGSLALQVECGCGHCNGTYELDESYRSLERLGFPPPRE